MDNSYPYNVLKGYPELLENVSVIDFVSVDAIAILEVLEEHAFSDDFRPGLVISLARAARSHLEQIEDAMHEIFEYCRAADVMRETYESGLTALTSIEETEEGLALRNLSRDMASMIEKVSRPAFLAITEMQNSAMEIDAMVQQARDMAGCSRLYRPADRDPDQPDFGSVAHTVGETMDPRTLRFAAAVARAKERSRTQRTEAA